MNAWQGQCRRAQAGLELLAVLFGNLDLLQMDPVTRTSSDTPRVL